MSLIKEVKNQLLLFLRNQDLFTVIDSSELNVDVKKALINCLNYINEIGRSVDDKKSLEIDSIIDFLHDELNTGHWSEVPLSLRQCFTCANFIKCLILLECCNNFDKKLFKKCLNCLDIGLLLGAPVDDNEFMTKSAQYLVKILQDNYNDEILETILPTAKRKLDEDYTSTYRLLKGKEIPSEECPSLEHFNARYFKTQLPVKIKGCMNHWPASVKWLNINYLLNVAGDRTVPVEIGSHYTDENWSQKLMTVKDFILKHYLSENEEVGYLAQHNLFEQIPELKQDIHIPEYCCLSTDYENATEPDINAWFGPKGTVSPLHYDPKNNILAQVYGTKQLILFSPKDTPYLYPHEDKMLFNTARVDPLKPDLEKHSDFLKTEAYKCLLEPGEMLFIPEKWWHHVTALDKSFSVSFWWQ